MREAALLLAGSFAIFMTWRGYRRGALATVAGWLPSLATLLVLILVLCREPERLSRTLLTAVLAATAVFFVVTLMVRTVRVRLRSGEEPISEDAGSRCCSWWCNHLVGAGLGLLWSATICLGVTCLVSLLPFAHSLLAQASADPEAPEKETPLWVTSLSQTARTLAAASERAVLGHVPLLREYGQEVRAVVTILNAPPQDLKRVARLHGITQLEDLPVVQTALDDKHYAELFLKLKEGDVRVVSELIDSSITRDLISCPEIRELTRTLTPSTLASDLDVRRRADPANSDTTILGKDCDE